MAAECVCGKQRDERGESSSRASRMNTSGLGSFTCSGSIALEQCRPRRCRRQQGRRVLPVRLEEVMDDHASMSNTNGPYPVTRPQPAPAAEPAVCCRLSYAAISTGIVERRWGGVRECHWQVCARKIAGGRGKHLRLHPGYRPLAADTRNDPRPVRPPPGDTRRHRHGEPQGAADDIMRGPGPARATDQRLCGGGSALCRAAAHGNRCSLHHRRRLCAAGAGCAADLDRQPNRARMGGAEPFRRFLLGRADEAADQGRHDDDRDPQGSPPDHCRGAAVGGLLPRTCAAQSRSATCSRPSGAVARFSRPSSRPRCTPC